MPVATDYGPCATRTLRAWMHRTGASCEYVAAKLAEYDIHVSPQLVSQWRTGEVHLPFAVIPALMAMGRPAMWTDALTRAASGLAGDDVTEDLLPVTRRATRALVDAGEVVAAVATALEDGRIDEVERARLAPIVREGLEGFERLHAALTAPRAAGSGR